MKATDQSRLRMCGKASKRGSASTGKAFQVSNWRKFEVAAIAAALGIVAGGIASYFGKPLAAVGLLSFSFVVSFVGSFVLLQRMLDLEE